MRKTKITLSFALLALALVSGCGSSYGGSAGSSPKSSSNASASGGGSAAVVKTASLPSASGSVLVDGEGLTLYHLSAEQNGKFICTGASCESLWHPLASAGGAPSGVAALSTIKRPDGSEQVTYRGMPLYTFAQDTEPGEAKGQGFKDVGTWSVVTVGSSSSGSPATSTGSTETSTGSSTSMGGGYHY